MGQVGECPMRTELGVGSSRGEGWGSSEAREWDSAEHQVAN